MQFTLWPFLQGSWTKDTTPLLYKALPSTPHPQLSPLRRIISFEANDIFCSPLAVVAATTSSIGGEDNQVSLSPLAPSRTAALYIYRSTYVLTHLGKACKVQYPLWFLIKSAITSQLKKWGGVDYLTFWESSQHTHTHTCTHTHTLIQL